MEGTDEVVEEPGPTSSQSDKPDGAQSSQQLSSLDKKLEEAAARKNLSVHNVKSILHHVLADKRVLAMVKKMAAEEASVDTNTPGVEDEIVYEPKLTRSHVRQALQTSVAKGTLSPEKLGLPATTSTDDTIISSPARLLDLPLSDESSDEEYDPVRDSHNTSLDYESFFSVSEDDGPDEMLEGSPVDEKEEEDEEETEDVEDLKDEDKMSVEDDDQTDVEEEAESNHSSVTATPDSIVSEPEDNNRTTVTLSAGSNSPSHSPEEKIEQDGTQSLTSDDNISHGPTLPSSAIDPPIAGSNTLVHITDQDALPNAAQGDANTHTPACDSNDIAVQEAASLLASLSDSLLTPPRPHLPPPSLPPSSYSEDAETIARRTRSKFPMTHTDISALEASFQPPDLPVDETSNPPLELDEDDLQWQQWLANLMMPSSVLPSEEEQDDDTEYNYSSDKQMEEKEEFRNDRAVMISQEEVDELIEELLNPSSGVFAEAQPFVPGANIGNLVTPAGLDLTSTYLLESLGLHPPMLTSLTPGRTPPRHGYLQQAMTTLTDPVPSTVSDNVEEEESSSEQPCYLSDAQTVQLWDQIQQHFQLLVQTFVLTRFEPSLVFLSQIVSQAIDEISRWCNESVEGKGSIVWYVPAQYEAKKLISKYDPHSNDTVELISAVGNPPKLASNVQEMIMSEGLFWQYPHLLPENGFAPLESSKSGSTVKYFTTAEDYLLVMGMDHYGSSSWKMIQDNLLPTKTPKQLHLRVKNLCSKGRGDNVVKHYKRTNEVKIPYPKTDTNTTKTDTTNADNTISEPPQWVITYLKRCAEKEAVQSQSAEPVQSTSRLPAAAARLIEPSGGLEQWSDSAAGSKRNLSFQLQAVESTAKRLKRSLEAVARNSVIGPKRRVGGQTDKEDRHRPIAMSPLKVSHSSPTSKPGADLNQLLYMAGLEASDPSARYAYNYLTEVKATVMDSPGTYERFLRVLTEARNHDHRQSKVFDSVRIVLEPWPHLIKLFTEFIDTQHAINTSSLSDKMDIEQLRCFIQRVKDKYADAPLKLDELSTTISGLRTVQPTRKKVLDSLTPILRAHDDLVDELRCYLHGIKPLNQLQGTDCYDEVDFSNIEKDDFETVHMNDSAALRPTTASIYSSSTSSPAVSKPVTQQETTSTPANSQKDMTENHASDHSPAAAVRPWMRDEDKVILEVCQEEGVSSQTVRLIANRLKRTTQEIEARCKELVSLFLSIGNRTF